MPTILKDKIILTSLKNILHALGEVVKAVQAKSNREVTDSEIRALFTFQGPFANDFKTILRKNGVQYSQHMVRSIIEIFIDFNEEKKKAEFDEVSFIKEKWELLIFCLTTNEYNGFDLVLAMKGTFKKDNLSLEYLTPFIEKNEAWALFNAGLIYTLGASGATKDLSKAVDFFQRAAELDYSVAQYNFAILLYKGSGIPMDKKKASGWLLKAANQNYSGAQFKLAEMLENGDGIPQDLSQAKQWYQRAADQGDGLAQFYLGCMYDLGKGMPCDKKQAFELFRKAAENEIPEAQFNVAEILLRQNTNESDQLAFAWMMKAAELGLANAQERVGFLLLNGRGVLRDLKAGFEWTECAANQGNAIALARLGDLLAEGRGVAQNIVLAIKAYLSAIIKSGDTVYLRRIVNMKLTQEHKQLITQAYEQRIDLTPFL